MRQSLMSRLRCPYCGTRLTAVENDALVRDGDGIAAGVVGCECCAFPVVDGIPVLIADDTARAAIQALESGRGREALEGLLGLDGPRTAAFRALAEGRTPATYRRLVEVLSPDAEGTYFLYRFSDPTFLTADAVLTALAADPRTLGGWALDVCGGSGHLTRRLLALQGGGDGPRRRTVLADVYFWKLWLARRITAPGCHAVCCDANQPLPFEERACSLAVLSDAFPYIWHKRLLAGELMRVTGPDGVVALPHLHSADGENHSQGMALTPGAYADLFAPMAPRLYRDALLLDGVVDRQAIDLSHPVAPDRLGDEPAVTLVAGRRAEPAAPFPLAAPDAVTGQLAVNPLYEVSRDGDGTRLRLAFPTPEYADEFGACTRYLPAEVRVAADLTGALDDARVRAALGASYDDLRRRRVLLDVPAGYC
ncbi:MAG: hypothetical protein AB7O28_11490 [Vicinamibacterales bacterium]